VTGVIVRGVQSIVWKPVTLFGLLVAPQPAVTDFFDFFAWDRMTVLVVTAFFWIPGMPLCRGDAGDHHRGGNCLRSHDI
jgi:hypothetical protein